MRTFFQDPLSRRSAKLPRRSRPNPRRHAELAEVARSRLRAAALHGDPLAAEAASRACAAALNLALVADIARALGAMLRPAWRRRRGRHARPVSVGDLEP
jgi:hypothetical protein